MYVDLRHALRLLGTCFNGLCDIDEEGLVGAREELDHGREATALPDGHTVVGILGTLSQGSNNIHKDLQDIRTHTQYTHVCTVIQCTNAHNYNRCSKCLDVRKHHSTPLLDQDKILKKYTQSLLHLTQVE